MPELPIACSLTPDALRARREGLLMDLVRVSNIARNCLRDCVSSLHLLERRLH